MSPPEQIEVVDIRAMRAQLALADDADIRSVEFLRFVVRLGEALDRDISVEDYAQLRTLEGALEFAHRHRGSREVH